MKRVKLMLLSLSVLAVVGGALAFTARTGTQVCTADAILNPDGSHSCPNACPSLIRTTTTTDPNMFICTTPSFNGGCVKNGVDLGCQALVNSTHE